jgi:chaperonin GroEL
MTCTFINPLILIADRNFNSIHEIMKPLELALDSSKPVLIVANDIDGDAMQGLVLNKVKGSLQVCAIKSPGFGSARHELLNDLEAVVGGKVLNSSYDMQSCGIEVFGTCKKVIIHKTTALFINEQIDDKSAEVNERIETVKEKLEDPGISSDEKELLIYRLQQLSGGIAILRVGAATESELIERFDRVDDSLNATKAAIQEGILPGGGVALVRASKKITNAISKECDDNVIAGLNVVSRACSEPFKQIVRNSGKSPDALLTTVMSSNENTGYDSRDDIFGDMFKLGIVDPKKVVRCAIENAASAASMLLSVGSSMIEVSKT